MKVIELLGDELEHCLNGKETMKSSKKLIMSKGTTKNSSRGRGRAVIKFQESPKPADTFICIIPRIITRWVLHIIHKPYSGNRLNPSGKAHKF